MAIGHIAMDKVQVAQFVENMIGLRPVGVDGEGNEVETAICPEMRSTVIAMIGDKTPWSGHTMLRVKDQARAMEAVLRSVADNIGNFLSDDKT